MKETFYFSHDCNARNDSKLQKIQMKHRLEGIGCYWCIIEMLYEEGGYISIDEYERIAFELRSQCELIKSVIEDFGLFYFLDGKFYSKSVLNRLESRKNKAEKAKVSAMARWGKISKDKDVKLNNNNSGNANALDEDANAMLIKKSKVKKSKYNTPPISPDVGEVREPIIKLSEIKEKLLSDEEWKAQACKQSGLSIKFVSMLPQQIDNFISWIKSIGEENTIIYLKDAKRRFIYWWAYEGKKQYANEINGNKTGIKQGCNNEDVSVRGIEL